MSAVARTAVVGGRAVAAPRRAGGIVAVVAAALVPAWSGTAPPLALLRVSAGHGEIATAVAIGDGRVLTVAHAVDGARDVRVDGRSARVVRVDRRLDLAELAVGPSRGTKVALGDKSVPLDRTAAAGNGAAVGGGGAAASGGDDVVVHVLRGGRPVALGVRVRRRATASIGEVSGRPVLELAAAIQPGDSGAPVTDARGRVVGMIFARSTRGGGAWAVALGSVS